MFADNTKFKYLSSKAFTLIALFCITYLCIADGALASNEYKIGPGDVLRIKVAGEEHFSGLYEVRSDNTIFYSYLKAIPLKNVTTDEAAAQLTDLLQNGYIHNPTVNVIVEKYASRKVKVLGAVRKQGTYVLRGLTKLTDVISMAGGREEKAGSSIVIIRNHGKPDHSTDNPQDTDDHAIIQPASLSEYITNEKTPAHEQQDKMESHTDESEGTVSVETSKNDGVERIVVNYDAIINRGKLDQDMVIEAGDIINIPLSDEIYILGQVRSPGPVKFDYKMTLLQAVSLAGGPLPTAATKSTYILRKQDSGTTKKMKIRLDKIMNEKAKNMPLEANDVIVIPESFF